MLTFKQLKEAVMENTAIMSTTDDANIHYHCSTNIERLINDHKYLLPIDILFIWLGDEADKFIMLIDAIEASDHESSKSKKFLKLSNMAFDIWTTMDISEHYNRFKMDGIVGFLAELGQWLKLGLISEDIEDDLKDLVDKLWLLHLYMKEDLPYKFM